MFAYSSNITDAIQGFDWILPPIEAKITKRIEAVVRTVEASLLAKTPVWQGTSVRNFIWAQNAEPAGPFAPIDNGPTGATNSMPLGTEPRRPPNEAESQRTVEALAFKRPWGRYVMSNKAEGIGELEAGQFPTSERSRAPQGFFDLTVELVLAKLSSGAL